MEIIEGFERAKSVLSRRYAFEPDEALEKQVGDIVRDVRENGDAALRRYTRKYDGVALDSLEVGKEEITAAYREVPPELLSALKLAAERVRSFHAAQRRCVWHPLAATGCRQVMRPLSRVGIYVPGGSYPLPSTVLMTAIPAAVAGVKEIIMMTPPGKDGTVSPATLVAADICRVSRIFKVGGAQAVAALAYGTESVPAVDKVCGPGNIYVTLAKKLVYGTVGIDGLAGPSEVLVIADDSANPVCCASDILAQAEHDRFASAIMVTTSRRLAEDVNLEIEEQLKGLKRNSIPTESLKASGRIVVVDTLDQAIELANLYAPEHLYLVVREAMSCVEKLTSAGCIVVGRRSTVALSDYDVGPSHVLPTGGSARFGSPLSVLDFVKLTSIVVIDEVTLQTLGPAAYTIAMAEGLEAHARAVKIRLEGKL